MLAVAVEFEQQQRVSRSPHFTTQSASQDPKMRVQVRAPPWHPICTAFDEKA
jgi:hypothetical protein